MDWSAVQLDTRAATPLYVQLFATVAEHISEGRLQPGEKLPSERKLAKLLSLSRTTTFNAYRELEARGLVRSYTGRGTFVSGRPERLGAPFAWRGKVSHSVQQHLNMNIRSLVALEPPDKISFGAGTPALEGFPTAAFATATEYVLQTRPREALGFLPTEGHPDLREAVAEREAVRPEEVLIVSGTQQALDLIARCLLHPQDTVVMDWPGYLGAIQTFRLAGAVLRGWDILTTDLDELEDLFLKRRPKLLYLNPTFQNPTGRTLPLGVRQGVIELAQRYRVPIIEDDAYRDLHFGTPPPPTLLELDGKGLVLHLRTFSKTFAPGLRLGYVIADESIIDQLSLVKAQSDLFSPGLSQLVMAQLLREGVFGERIRALRKQHCERAKAMERALQRHFSGALYWQASEGGLYVWAQLGVGESRTLLQRAAEYGVGFAVGDSFFPDGSGKRALRLCYSGTTQEQIAEGIKRLAAAFGDVAALS